MPHRCDRSQFKKVSKKVCWSEEDINCGGFWSLGKGNLRRAASVYTDWLIGSRVKPSRCIGVGRTRTTLLVTCSYVLPIINWIPTKAPTPYRSGGASRVPAWRATPDRGSRVELTTFPHQWREAYGLSLIGRLGEVMCRDGSIGHRKLPACGRDAHQLLHECGEHWWLFVFRNLCWQYDWKELTLSEVFHIEMQQYYQHTLNLNWSD